MQLSPTKPPLSASVNAGGVNVGGAFEIDGSAANIFLSLCTESGGRRATGRNENASYLLTLPSRCGAFSGRKELESRTELAGRSREPPGLTSLHQRQLGSTLSSESPGIWICDLSS